jgi:hypothetical protein
MRSGNVYSFIVLGFAAFLVLMFVIGIQQNWGIFRQPTKEDATNTDAVSQFALEEGAVDVAALDLVMNLIPPSSGEEIRALDFQVDELTFYVRDDDDTVTVKEVCLDYIFLILQPQSEETASSASTTGDPYCLPIVESDYVEEPYDIGGYSLDRSYWVSPRNAPDSITIRIDDPDVLNLNFWYPYDAFKVDLVLQVQYSLTLENDEQIVGTVSPFIKWNIQTSGTRLWDIKLIADPEMPIDPVLVENYLGTDPTYDFYDTYSITFNRLLLYRIIFPFFMVAMVLLLCFMPLFSERDSLIDVSAAMLFGIFGLKGIIGPGDQMGQTVMDIALIGLYVLLAFAVFLFFIRRLMSPRQSQE